MLIFFIIYTRLKLSIQDFLQQAASLIYVYVCVCMCVCVHVIILYMLYFAKLYFIFFTFFIQIFYKKIILFT